MAGHASEPSRIVAEDSRRPLGVGLGVAVVAALTYIDARFGAREIVIGTVVLGPLLCALLGTARDVALVGVVATVLAAVSGVWNDNFDSAAYFLRVAVVALGSAVATLASARRQMVSADRGRFAMLAGVAEVGTGTLTLDETAARVTALVVPTIADVCIIDVVSRGELRRLAVRVRDGSAADIEAAVLARRPTRPGAPGSGDVVATSKPVLVERVDDDLLRRSSHDDEDLALLRSLRMRSSIVVPLVARGRALGALTVSVTAASRRTYEPSDLEFVEVLAGRVALALDNAGLFSELETIEAQLGAAMSGLAEAVTIQRAGGALVYANQAAARMLGFDTPQELLAAPVAEVMAAFDSTHEDGSPLRPDELPGRKLLAGLEAEPLVVRAVHRQTGEERWRVTKATPVHDRHGNVSLVVNVVEDITDVKRAELGQRLLAQAGELLASSLDYDRTLQQVAELAVPRLADWCAVSLPDGRGFIRTVAVAHVDPTKIESARRIGDRYPVPENAPTGVPQVMRQRAAQLVNDITPDMLAAAAQDAEHAQALTEVGMRAALIVPMLAGGRAIGALTLISAESNRRFSPADVELAEELARRAGTAVENARLYTERSHIAGALQAALLPDALPAMPGWAVRSLYRPAGAENWVGGDFYDVVHVDGGWLLLVGDVAGHGADAAALTALARHTLRDAAELLPDPLDAVARLNHVLATRSSGHRLPQGVPGVHRPAVPDGERLLHARLQSGGDERLLRRAHRALEPVARRVRPPTCSPPAPHR